MDPGVPEPTRGAVQSRAVAADAAAVIERMSVDLALTEEPPRLMAVLEAEPDRE